VELLSEQDLYGLELMVGVDLKNNVDFAQSFDFNCIIQLMTKAFQSKISNHVFQALIYIHPFNPDKAFNHLPAKPQNTPSTLSMTVFPQTPTTVTTTPTTPFPTQVLMSLPSNFTILQAANSTLNRMIESAQPLPTPACKLVRCLTTTVEKLYTCTSILQERTEVQATLLAARQQ
jgi:hypothetical protein